MCSTGHCSLENHARPDANYMEQAQIQTYTERESAFHLECRIGQNRFFLLRDNWWETKTASLGWKELSKTNFSPCLRIITWFDQFLQPRSPTSAAFCAEKPSQTTTSRASHNYWGHSGCQSSHQARFGSVTWMRSCIWHIPMLTALKWRKNPSCNWTNMLKPI